MIPSSGLIPVNKCAGLSSHDVVNRIRKLLGLRKVGHTGTLDEMATGVLPILFGRATRAADYAQSADKSYRAGIRFGMTSDTQDVWGNVLSRSCARVAESDLRDALASFLGERTQIPPMYSAIRKNGVRLYDLARAGVEAEREPRRITVFRAELLSFREDVQEAEIDFSVSKGTYIRTLCHDLGAFLGPGAVMTSLCRTESGPFRLSECFTLEELEKKKEEGLLASCIRPVETLSEAFPSMILSPGEETDLRFGRRFPSSLQPGRAAAFSGSGEFIGICEILEGECRLIKGFYETERRIAP